MQQMHEHAKKMEYFGSRAMLEAVVNRCQLLVARRVCGAGEVAIIEDDDGLFGGVQSNGNYTYIGVRKRTLSCRHRGSSCRRHSGLMIFKTNKHARTLAQKG